MAASLYNILIVVVVCKIMLENNDVAVTTKRARVSDASYPIPSSLIVNFVDGDGNRAGPPVGTD